MVQAKCVKPWAYCLAWTYWSIAYSPSTEGGNRRIKTSRSFFTIWHLGLFSVGANPTFYYQQLDKDQNCMHTGEREGSETESAGWQNGKVL